MHGKGILELTNEETFNGEFQNGMVHGFGAFVDINKKKVEGKWEEGVFKKAK